MKKYVKPELFYESFELAEQIAVGCSSNVLVNYADGNSCQADDFNGTGWTVFSTVNVNCTTKSNVIEGYCYHSGADGFTIFSS